MRKESRQWADGVVSTPQGARERISPFVRPYENGNYEMEKELEKSWGKMGDRREATTELVAGEDKKEEEMAAGLIRGKKYD